MKARQLSDAILRAVFFAAVFVIAVIVATAAEKGTVLTGKGAMGDWTRDAPGVMRSLATPLAPATQPMAVERSIAILRAAAIRLWAQALEPPQQVTVTFILVQG